MHHLWCMLGMGPPLAIQWSARCAVNYLVKIRPDFNRQQDTVSEVEGVAGVNHGSLLSAGGRAITQLLLEFGDMFCSLSLLLLFTQ
jgi:hypothetical protein